MLTKTKMALAAALMLGSASAGFAQTVVPDYDGDGNPVPGSYEVLPQTGSGRAASSIERSFAGPRTVVREPAPYPSYGANGTAWQRHFDDWLSSVD